MGVVVFGGLSVAAIGYYSSGFGGALSAPAGSDEAVGNALLARHFPATSANPANVIFRYAQPVWSDPAVLVQAQRSLTASGLFSQLAGPLDPNGTTISPATLTLLHERLGLPLALPLSEPAALQALLPASEYTAYRSLVQFISADGRVVQFEASLKIGTQDSTPALHATPEVRRAGRGGGPCVGRHRQRPGRGSCRPLRREQHSEP